MGYQPPTYAEPAAQVNYASFWIRLAAAFIDGFIVSVALIVVFIVIGLIAGAAAAATGSSVATTTTTPTEVLADVIYLLLYAGYFVYFWGMGQTPAMRWFGIYVADITTGGPIGFGRALTRFLGYMLSYLACYIGLIWALFDPRRQGWHDKLANTVVIRL